MYPEDIRDRRAARYDTLDPGDPLDRAELTARAFDDLCRSLADACRGLGPGLDAVRRSIMSAADAAALIASLTRYPVTVEHDRRTRLRDARTDTVYGIRPHRGTAIDAATAAAMYDARPLSREYLADLLGAAPGGGRACRIHDEAACEGGCPGRAAPTVAPFARWLTEWEHTDGTPCQAGFMAPTATPDHGAHWWCTEHSRSLRLRHGRSSPTPDLFKPAGYTITTHGPDCTRAGRFDLPTVPTGQQCPDCGGDSRRVDTPPQETPS